MTIAMQMVLKQFIEDNASIQTMYEVISDLRDVKAWQRAVEAYKERGLYEYVLNAKKNLESAKERCNETLKKTGIEYTVEELLIL